MNDLHFTLLLMAALCGGFLWLGFRTGRAKNSVFRMRVQFASLLLMAGYLTFLWNRPVLTRLLPTPNLIIVANWLPFWGAFFVGLYLGTPGFGLRRKSFLSLITIVLVVYSTVAPLVGTSPQCEDAPARELLLYQSTPYTCSAACAASLLRIHGISATENELAELCLTRHGTHWMGVYRGLMRKTEGSGWRVVAEPFSREVVMNSETWPCVLSVDVDITRFAESIDHGFQSDTGHSVVCFGGTQAQYVSVFDPSPDFGAEDWSDEIFECIRSGVILRLVPRSPDSPAALEVQRKLLAIGNAHAFARM